MKFLFKNRDNEIRTDRRREAGTGTSRTGAASPFGVQINALKPLVPWIH